MDDISKIRSYCLSLTDPTQIEDLAQRLESLQLNRPPLPVTRTSQGLAGAAVSFARGGREQREDVLAAIDKNAHPEQYARMEAAIAGLGDDHTPEPGWEERVFEQFDRKERSLWARLRRFWGRFLR